MSNHLYRLAVVVSLVLYACCAAVFTTTASNNDLATVSGLAFLAAQTALGVSAVGLGQLLRERTPVLAPLAAGLLFLSAFGHAAAAGLMLSARPAEAAVPVGINIIAPVTMIGLVGGTIALAIALFRAKIGAAWLGVVLLGWIVVEFALSDLGIWAAIASGALLLTGFIGLAVITARSDLRHWADWSGNDHTPLLTAN